jgi:hypothetical protein
VTELSEAVGLAEFPIAIVVVPVWVNVDSDLLEVVVTKIPIVVGSARKEELAHALDHFGSIFAADSSSVVASLYIWTLWGFEQKFFEFLLVESLGGHPWELVVPLWQLQVSHGLIYSRHQLLHFVEFLDGEFVEDLDADFASAVDVLD